MGGPRSSEEDTRLRWIGSRRIVDKNPQFTSEVEVALREWRGPGFYRSTGERISFEVRRTQGSALYIENEKDFDNLLK